MPSINSLKVIERRIKELREKADEIRQNEQDGVEALRAVIVKYKLGFAHFKMAMRGASTPRGTRTRAKVVPAPKYRSPYNPAVVWSGRGRRPSWIVAGLKNGGTIEEFLIRGDQEEVHDRSSIADEFHGDLLGDPIKPSATPGGDLSERRVEQCREEAGNLS